MSEKRDLSLFESHGKDYACFPIGDAGEVARLPYSIRILLENVLRNLDGSRITREHAEIVAGWPEGAGEREIPFMPSRVVLQDFTGVPCVVDLTAMRSALLRHGVDPGRLNPVIPVDLVIDHSVQVDYFGTDNAFRANVQKEYERNRERYSILKWAQQHFDGFRVVPPGTGIVHQVNLEYLSQVVATSRLEDRIVAFPDTLLGTDSHSTMVNGIAVLGWGVGGIEAEAVMLGQPYFMLLPDVVGFRLTGALKEGATATDLVLTVTQILRAHGVVGKFVEFTGPGVSALSLPDRATIANMAPEYGATMGFFPVDGETLDYLARTGRGDHVDLVRTYTRLQHMFRADEGPEPEYREVLTLDLAEVKACVSGPGRPQDRIALEDVPSSFRKALPALTPKRAGDRPASAGEEIDVVMEGKAATLRHGSVAIAAITSCTNTSNPSVLMGAGLIAKKAVQRGLSVQPSVKTSLAPGSRVVTNYLKEAGLLPYLEALRFNVVGYGCTTCIGNSGPLPEQVARAVEKHGLVVCAVLSGNRNFEARIHPQVRANYLASPLLVVAYALAGRVDIDFAHEPVGYARDGEPVFLRDIWPSQREIAEEIAKHVSPSQFTERYREVFEGDELWKLLEVPGGDLYRWDSDSTYIQEPPFFTGFSLDLPALEDIRGARVLVMLGDSVTTDHISPAGAISSAGPAGKYLAGKGVRVSDFNTYGSRRGNHEVMIRGTFANVRLKNLLLEGVEGGFTVHHPSGRQMAIYDAAVEYQREGTPLLVIAGREYGAGSSRDWAAKGTRLLGVKAVIAESYERIHRANLLGVGILPLQFAGGENRETLGLGGLEVFSITGIAEGLVPKRTVEMRAEGKEGVKTFEALVRLDSAHEVEVFRHGGILPMVLRRYLGDAFPQSSSSR